MEKTYVHHAIFTPFFTQFFTPFFTLGPASTTLYSTHALSHGLISSTTLYSLQLYSSSTVYNLYNTPLGGGSADGSCGKGRWIAPDVQS